MPKKKKQTKRNKITHRMLAGVVIVLAIILVTSGSLFIYLV